MHINLRGNDGGGGHINQQSSYQQHYVRQPQNYEMCPMKSSTNCWSCVAPLCGGVHRFGVPVPLRPIPISIFKHQYSSMASSICPVYFMSWPSWLMREVLQLESTHCDVKLIVIVSYLEEDKALSANATWSGLDRCFFLSN